MVLVLAAVTIVTGSGNLWLLSIGWRHRSVLPALCAAAGAALAVNAIASGASTAAGHDQLAGAVASLLIGFVLDGLGQSIWKLLNYEPEEGG